MLGTATSSYAKIKSFRIKSNFSRGETKSLRNLTKQKDIIIKKAYKGNTEVILNKVSYIEKMKELLSDTSKFECLEILPDKHLNCVINSQNKIKNILKSCMIKRVLLIYYIRKCSLLDTTLGFYMAKPKVHKSVINNYPSFRPILGAINTPSYKL